MKCRNCHPAESTYTNTTTAPNAITGRIGSATRGTDIGNSHIGFGTRRIGGTAGNIINVGIYWLAYVAGGNCSELSPTAFRILCKMALSCLDDDDTENGQLAGIYYGGWKSLAFVLGDGTYSRDESLPPNVHKKIQRGIRELRESGYIADVPRDIARLHPGRRVYGLNTDIASRYRDTNGSKPVD